MKLRHKIGALTALALSLAAAQASAATPPLAPLQRPGPDVRVVRGSFVQDKHLAELNKPLESSGRFTLIRGTGLIWSIEKPIQSTLVITHSRLLQVENGQTQRAITAKDQPGLRVVTAILLAVFNADTDRLKQYFKVQTQATGDKNWRMDLSPRKPGVAKVVKHARLSGSQHVNRITLDQPGGDRTIMHLHENPNTPNQLTPHERQLVNES